MLDLKIIETTRRSFLEDGVIKSKKDGYKNEVFSIYYYSIKWMYL